MVHPPRRSKPPGPPAGDGAVTVSVTPIVERFRIGQAQTDKLEPNDPSLPGWVSGKADSLLVSIHARAKQYAVAP